MQFEMVQKFHGGNYSHIGPYNTIDEAIEDGVKRLRGCKTMHECIIQNFITHVDVYEIRKSENDDTRLIHTARDIKPILKPVRLGMFGARPGQGNSGYGSRISTDYMVKFNDKEYRVYCICYSNTGSLYIRRKKEMVFVQEYDLTV